MKKQSRRKFITAASALALAPSAIGSTVNGKADPQIIHHVFFWLNKPGDKADRRQLLEGLKSLGSIPVIKKLLTGTPAPTEQRDVVDSSYDVSELMFFDNAADQKAYQDHPVHKAFVEKYSHLWKKVIVYDMLAEQEK
ncbi:MAG TPA: Dabb family protein [Chitinophagaceae bacterium]|nr:Dabb family protein [Chitinophagaceae bacterium]